LTCGVSLKLKNKVEKDGRLDGFSQADFVSAAVLENLRCACRDAVPGVATPIAAQCSVT